MGVAGDEGYVPYPFAGWAKNVGWPKVMPYMAYNSGRMGALSGALSKEFVLERSDDCAWFETELPPITGCPMFWCWL